jgi:hypothetical protein
MPLRCLATCVALLVFGLVSADAPPAQAQDKSVTLKMSSWVLLRTL